jgi:hypothetical protein
MIYPTNEMHGTPSAVIWLGMTESQKHVREYLAKIGKRGGLVSRRELTKAHARQMVAIREMKRAAIREGKRWPPRNRKLLKFT